MDREELRDLELTRAIDAVKDKPKASLRDLEGKLGIPKDTVKRLLNNGGWNQSKGAWVPKK